MKIVYIAEHHGHGPGYPTGWLTWIAHGLRDLASRFDDCFVIGVYGLHEDDRPAMAALVAQGFAARLAVAYGANAELERVVSEHRERT